MNRAIANQPSLRCCAKRQTPEVVAEDAQTVVSCLSFGRSR